MEPHNRANSQASSLQTSLLPSDSDDNETKDFTPSVYMQYPPPRPYPIDFEASDKSLQSTAGWALACFICLLFLPTILISRPNVGQPPTSRKSSSMALFSSSDASPLPLLYSNSRSSFKKPGLNSSYDMLVVYSGMGHDHRLLNDTFVFDLQKRQWTRVLSEKHDIKEPHPDPRWKSAAVSIKNKGLLLLFGDAMQWNDDDNARAYRTTTSTSGGVGKSRKFDDHVWMLEVPRLKWQAANITKKERSSPYLIPQARRGHTVTLLEKNSPSSTSSLKAAAALPKTQIERETTVLLFGGVSAQGEELNDTWKATISWPNITWTRLGRTEHRLQTAETSIEEEAKPLQRPSPRYGHATAILETSTEIFKESLETTQQRDDDLEEEEEETIHRYMVVFGGRDTAQFFNDVWMLNLDNVDQNSNNNNNINNNNNNNNNNISTTSVGKKGGDDGKSGEWLRFQIDPTSPIPPACAYHTIAIFENKLCLFGGLSGPRQDISKPLDDLWVLSFETRRWYRLNKHGAWPLPRFLTASVVHQPQSDAEPRLYIFGGESLDRCKLNDLWSLNLKSVIWTQLTPNFFAKRRCDKLFG